MESRSVSQPTKMPSFEMAACRGDDLNLYFPLNEASRSPETLRQINQAKEVCRGCPEITPCLTYALGRPESYGIWGGTTGPERDALRRRDQRRRATATSTAPKPNTLRTRRG
jgi:WhiB family redox-sensing transcriptional regulator